MVALESDVDHLSAVDSSPLDADVVPVPSRILIQILLYFLEPVRRIFVVQKTAQKCELRNRLLPLPCPLLERIDVLPSRTLIEILTANLRVVQSRLTEERSLKFNSSDVLLLLHRRNNNSYNKF